MYGIQLAAYSALLATAREDATRGARALVAIINTLQQDEALTARLSGGRSTLDRLLLVGQDAGRFTQWRKDGILPDLPAAPSLLQQA